MRQPVPFGKYLLLDRISVGGMAEVFKAKSYGVEGFEKIIAIKRILPTMGEDRDFIKMFIDEAKIAGQLAHANICQIFELGRIDGSHFIAMEYIWGKDLLQIQNRLKKNKTQMPVAMACFCIAKVLEGLDYAHRKRDPLGRPLEIVHRDCSPQNVLVSYEGEVKVIDFGIAKATSRNSRTMAGVLKGKFGYMSPEQVRGLPLDRRSDIFAIGTMLYECLTGERLFQGETDFSTLEKVRNVDIQAPRAINPSIPEAVEKVILKALAKDVDDRYQWCSEMLADLQQFLMGQDVVFTAKSLSGWLKEVFSPEIDRERQLLEQYKRVGRDGLIAGATAAKATGDINENLGHGEAPPEADATQLGGPSFEEMEHGVGAAPDVNQSPMSPRISTAGPAVGGPRGAVQRATPPKGKGDQRGGDDQDFGEEAPTEIFGDEGAPPVPAGQAARPSSPANARNSAPIGSKLPSQPSIARPSANQMGAAAPTRPTAAGPAVGPGAADSLSAMTAAATPHAQGYGHNASTMIASGTPNVNFTGGSPPPAMRPPGDSGESNRTVLGMQAPIIPNYGGGATPGHGVPGANGGAAPPYRPSGQQPVSSPSSPKLPNVQSMATPQQPHAAYPSYPQQGQGSNPSYPSYQSPYPSGPQGAPQSGPYSPSYPNMQGFGGPTGPAPTEAAALAEGKRSTLVRDIGIGVGIAALVLVGFLVVKLFVLDKSSAAKNANSTLATVKLKMPPNMTAEMFVDGSRIGTIANDQTVGIKAGVKHIKLVGTNGLTCDDDKVSLESGKTTTLECGFGAGGAGGAGSGSAATASATGSAAGSAAPATTAAGSGAGSGAGSAAATGSGSAAAAQGSAAGAGSAVATKVDTKSDATKTTATTKTGDLTTKTDTTKTDTSKTTKTDATKTDTTKTDTTKTDATKTTKTDTAKTDTTKTDTSKTTKTDATKTTKTDATKTTKTDTSKTTKGDGDQAGDPTKGYLQVFSKPQAKILVDGVETNMKTPINGHALALTPGKHKITFVIGDDRFTYPVVIKAGSTDTMSKDLQ